MPSGGVSFRRPDVQAYGGLLIPCGTCIGCQLSRGREWAIRCGLELQDHVEACWCTLTYDSDFLPPTLRKVELSDFIERLRTWVDYDKFRFFGSGEYGERRGRPHYHVILFGLSMSAPIQQAWPFGDVRVDSITDGTIPYVAGYAVKKVFSGAPKHAGYQPPFVLMSRRPGIGSAARRYVADWRRSAIYSGREVPVPRYLHEAYKASVSAAEYSLLVAERDASAYERSASRFPERLAAAEKIAASRVALSSERRLVE